MDAERGREAARELRAADPGLALLILVIAIGAIRVRRADLSGG